MPMADVYEAIAHGNDRFFSLTAENRLKTSMDWRYVSRSQLSIHQKPALIAEAGREPVERDARYRRVNRSQADPSSWTVEPVVLTAPAMAD